MKALIFDMDGVIVDSEPYNMRRVYEYVLSIRPKTSIEEMYQVVGRTKKDVWTRISNVIGQGKGWEETRMDYEKNWKPFHEFEINYKQIFRPEVIGILQWARVRGMSTAVASSTGYAKVKQILSEVGVLPYLDLVTSGEDFEKSKPDPAIYLKTAELLGVLPEECLAIEDSEVGILAASRAGIKVIALREDRFGFDQSLADARMDTFQDFEACYKKIAG
ncbi:MAG: HAD family hydrolase [Lachnospiraceae bacterium]